MPYTPEEDRFILEAYFRTGNRNSNGTWGYSVSTCQLQFEDAFPDKIFRCMSFRQHVTRLVSRFRETGSVSKGKSSGRPHVCNNKVMIRLKQMRKMDPSISLEKLAFHAGISYGACQRAMASMRTPEVEEVYLKEESNE